MGNAHVWGHTTVGHTSRNFALREFDASAGKGTEGHSFAGTYIFDDKLRARALEEVVCEIGRRNYVVDPTTPAFQKAAARELKQHFYNAYAQANANLSGVHPRGRRAALPVLHGVPHREILDRCLRPKQPVTLRRT